MKDDDQTYELEIEDSEVLTRDTEEDFVEKDSSDLPKLDAFILSVSKTPVKDSNEDPFLKEFNEDNCSNVQKFFSIESDLKKGFENESGSSKSKQREEDGVSLYNAVDCMEVPYPPVALAALYEKSGVHAAVVDAKIDNIIGLGYYWKYTRRAEKIRQRAARKDDDTAKQRVEDSLIDDRHSMDDLVNSMNKNDSFREILKKVLKDRFTVGNGYLEVGRNRNGTIGYIGHIPATTMRVRRERDGYVQYANNQPIFFRNFGDKRKADPFGNDPQPNEVIHIKQYTPTNNYYGVPEIVAAIDNIAGIEFANKYNIDYFENKALPRFIITTKGVSVGKGTYKNMLEFFEAGSSGKHHRSMFIPLPNVNSEINFQAVENQKQDASWLEYNQENTKHILARHRTPANRIGMSSGGGIGDSRDSNKIFKETVCKPEQDVIEDKLKPLFRELTDLFSFKLNEYTLTDENEQAQIHERKIRMGIMLPDEARGEIGLAARPDGEGDQAVDIRSLQLLAQKSKEKLAAASQKAAVATAGAGVNPTAKKASDAKANTQKNRTRDANRSANKTDGTGATNSRAPKGAGRQQS